MLNPLPLISICSQDLKTRVQNVIATIGKTRRSEDPLHFTGRSAESFTYNHITGARWVLPSSGSKKAIFSENCIYYKTGSVYEMRYKSPLI